MKEVYVLLGEISYEGQYLLGVYSTLKKAEKAREDFAKTHQRNNCFCGISVHPRPLNGAAKVEF